MIMNSQELYAIAQGKGLTDYGDESDFSYSGCDKCADRLGNNTRTVKIWLSVEEITEDKEGNTYTLELCDECVYDLHY